jgi:hypothetical protein
MVRCPRCSRDIPRAPRGSDRRHVSVTEATYRRLKAHAELVGMSLGALVDALTQDLGSES